MRTPRFGKNYPDSPGIAGLAFIAKKGMPKDDHTWCVILEEGAESP
jgi:hypothetical protein